MIKKAAPGRLARAILALAGQTGNKTTPAPQPDDVSDGQSEEFRRQTDNDLGQVKFKRTTITVERERFLTLRAERRSSKLINESSNESYQPTAVSADENEKQNLKEEKIMTSRKIFGALFLTGMIATVIAVTGSQRNAQGGGSTAPGLEGSWEVTVLPDEGDPIVDVATLTSGGGIINSDPDPALSTGHGTWVRTGGDQFATTFVHFFSAGGAPVGTIKVRGVMQLDRATDTFSGPFRTDVIIGGEVVQSFCGTVQAKRISVEPIEPCP